jgi:hypothetical protein
VTLGELQSVTVGILNESHVVVTAGPVRLRFECKFHTFRFQLRTELVQVRDIQGDVTVPGEHFLYVAGSARFYQF